MRRTLKIIGWNLGLLVIVILIVEVVFGSWFRAPQLWHLSIYRDKDWLLDVSDKYIRSGPSRYKRDYYALRGSYGEPKDIDILVMGGSTTDERFVSEGETWPDTLGACLSKSLPDLRVANAGVTGQTTRGHAANFDLWLNHIPELRPAAIIAFFGVNEFFVHALAEKDDVRLFSEANYGVSQIRIFRKWLYMNSALHAGYKVIKKSLSDQKPDFAYVQPPPAKSVMGVDEVENRIAKQGFSGVSLNTPEFEALVGRYSKKSTKQLVAYRGRLQKLRESIHEFGSQPVFVTQAWGSYRIGSDGAIRGDLNQLVGVEAYNRVVMDYCAKTGMHCIDLARKIRFQRGDFWDVAHTTPQGSARIGNEMCKELQSMRGLALKKQ